MKKLMYIPHGVDEKVFRPLTTNEEQLKVAELRKKITGSDTLDFVILFNNRNISRKRPGSVIDMFKRFYKSLHPQQQKGVALIMHTQPSDDNGTDITAVIRDTAPNLPIYFTNSMYSPEDLNILYNTADVVVNISQAEGFGLATLEAMVAGRMIIVNVTGGLQDQCGFRDDTGTLLHEDVHYTSEWGTNADGFYRNHGAWVRPVFPASRSLIGSPPTPYIYDDYCSVDDVVYQLMVVYNLSKEIRDANGLLGREYAISQGMTSEGMTARMIKGIDHVLDTWTPPQRFDLYKL